MRTFYDVFDGRTRKRLQRSRYNICAACVEQTSQDWGVSQYEAVEIMERVLDEYERSKG